MTQTVQKMDKNPFDDVGRYFDAKTLQHGHSPKACDWSGQESQHKRFQVLCEVLPLDGLSILDVGCGLAHLADYLEEKGIRAHYLGFDISADMVGTARARRPDLDIRHDNILHAPETLAADVVMASGVMARLGGDPQPWFESLVTVFFARARKALAFNCLSAWGTNHEPDEFYPDPLAVVQFCRSLSPWVCLRHDYHPRDFTIYLYKEKN